MLKESFELAEVLEALQAHCGGRPVGVAVFGSVGGKIFLIKRSLDRL